MVNDISARDETVRPTNKTLESLIYLRNFIEKYERHKEDLLFTLSKNSLTYFNIEELSDISQVQKPRKKFVLTKPSSLVNFGRDKKSVTNKRENSFKKNKTDITLNNSTSSIKFKKEPLSLYKNKGKLCKDSTKRRFNNEGIFTLCTQSQKNSSKKANNKLPIIDEKEEPNTNVLQISQDKIIKMKETKKLKPLDISNSLLELEDMDLERVKSRLAEFEASSSESQNDSKNKIGKENINDETTLNIGQVVKRKDSGKPVPLACTQEEIEKLLKESKYTKSEIDILLGELIEFPKMEEAIQRFTDVEWKRNESIKMRGSDVGDEKTVSEEMNIDSALDISEKAETEFRESNAEDKETEDDKTEEFRKKIPTSLIRPFSMKSKLEGTLYKDMARYYTTKLEALTNVKKHFKGEMLSNLKEILGNTLREYGLPENATVLRDLVSKSEEKLRAAEDYENIIKMKLSRGEKYESRATETLKDLFDIPIEKEKDLMHVLAPYLNKEKSKQLKKPETKTKSEHSGKSKKKEKKSKEVKEDGPFNIMKKNSVRRSVWRAALKRAKRKIKYLSLAIRHREKTGLLHESYHEHFAEYFKKKRTEIKRLRKRRKLPTAIRIRNIDLSEAESTSSFSSGDYYPEKALLNSMFYSYDELQNDMPVKVLRGKWVKRGKIEKLRQEKLSERAGVTSSQWAPNTEQEETRWHEKARKTYEKRRDRIVESYLYSSGDELTGLKNAQKEGKQRVMKQLTESLIPEDVRAIQSAVERPIDKQNEEPEEANQTETVREKFKAVCYKYKMKYIYALICSDCLLKSPYDLHFMTAIAKMGNALIPYENDNSFYTSVIHKFLKMAARTCLGMFLIMQKENKALDEKYEGSKNLTEEKVSSNALPLSWILRNATIDSERENNWVKKYLGMTNSLKTEEKMPLYFGPPSETCVSYGPIRKKQK